MLTTHRPMRVAVLCSRRAPGLERLIEETRTRQEYEIVCIVSTEPDAGDSTLRGSRAPVLTHDIRAFCAARAPRVAYDREARHAYDSETVERLRPYAPDVVVLDGYLYLLTSPMLRAYPNRIINLHFSDLTVRQPDGRPTYPGIRAVRDAVLDGSTETRGTVHLVDGEPDGGAPLLLSWPFAVAPVAARAREWNRQDMLKAYVYAHQEWMMREVSGPLLVSALHLIASGRISLDIVGAVDPASVLPWSLTEAGCLVPPAARPMGRAVVRAGSGSPVGGPRVDVTNSSSCGREESATARHARRHQPPGPVATRQVAAPGA